MLQAPALLHSPRLLLLPQNLGEMITRLITVKYNVRMRTSGKLWLYYPSFTASQATPKLEESTIGKSTRLQLARNGSTNV